MAAQSVLGLRILGHLDYNRDDEEWAVELGEKIAGHLRRSPQRDQQEIVSQNHHSIRRQVMDSFRKEWNAQGYRGSKKMLRNSEDLLTDERPAIYAIILISVFAFLANSGFANTPSARIIQILQAQLDNDSAELGISTDGFQRIIPNMQQGTLTVANVSDFIVNLIKPLTVLILTSSPIDCDPLRVDAECLELEAASRRTQFGTSLIRYYIHNCRVQDISAALYQYNPDILQFSGHGYQGGLVFQDDFGASAYVDTFYFAQLLSTFSKLKLVILNACHTQLQAHGIASRIGFAIGMQGTALDTNSIEFSREFYGALGQGGPVQNAFDRAHAVMRMSTTMLPFLFQH